MRLFLREDGDWIEPPNHFEARFRSSWLYRHSRGREWWE